MATSLGHTPGDMRKAMAGFEGSASIASPRRDSDDPGTGDRVVPDMATGKLGRLPGAARLVSSAITSS